MKVYLKKVAFKSHIDRIKAERIAAYILQWVLQQQAIVFVAETQFSRAVYLPGDISCKALIYAGLNRIEGVQMQFVANNVACVGTFERNPIVIPAYNRPGIAGGVTTKLQRSGYQYLVRDEWLYDHRR